MKDLYQRLREKSSDGRYSFQAQEEQPVKVNFGSPVASQIPRRSTVSTSPTQFRQPSYSHSTTNSTAQSRIQNGIVVHRTDDLDRPYAYPAPPDSAELQVWSPPGMEEVLRDLALRIVEVVIVAVATAIATELSNFFAFRRFGGGGRRRKNPRFGFRK